MKQQKKYYNRRSDRSENVSEHVVAEIYDINNEGKKQHPKQMKDKKPGMAFATPGKILLLIAKRLW